MGIFQRVTTLLNNTFRVITMPIRGIQRTTRTISNLNKARIRNKKNKRVEEYQKPEYKTEEEGYITTVDDFKKSEVKQAQPEYIYTEGSTSEVGIIEEELGEEFEEDYEAMTDLWEEGGLVETPDDKELINNLLDELNKEDTEELDNIINYYITINQPVEDIELQEEYIIRNKVKTQIYNALLFNDMSYVPLFLGTYEDVVEQLINKVDIPVNDEEVKAKLVSEEVKRYKDMVIKLLSITVKDGQYYIDDWRFGVQLIDYMVKHFSVPEMALILTPYSLQEQVSIMRNGYLPTVFKETPLNKMYYLLENSIETLSGKKGDVEYRFPIAYRNYKERMPMYTRLRNNNNLPNINNIIGYYYKEIQNIRVNESYQGDVYFGINDPYDFFNAYLQFFYGRAKQTETMGNLMLKLMEKNPTIASHIGDTGYAVLDNPKGGILVIAGHIVVLTPTDKSGGFTPLLDKAPSDLLVKDIDKIAGMIDKEKEKPKQEKTDKSKKEFNQSYDYEEATKMWDRINKQKRAK